ncbi:hypothetical protein ACQ9BO_07190 [Flavobacterium sp. P21]|uniref:hypothetical protein n=1 Tax=Flavobacterium sp. P21 TaxID=3423948 RepID=UPI003D67D694
MGNQNLELDGELFLSGSTPPLSPSYQKEIESTYYSENALFGETTRYQLEYPANSETTLYERVLFVTKDPTSLPNTREKCVKWCSAGPIKTCCGWKIQYKWLYVTGVLKVSTARPVNIQEAIEDCLKQGAIVVAITTIISGGSVAIPAAEAAFKACLASKLGENLLTVSITLHHKRGDWE